MERQFLDADFYHRPIRCEKCGGIMIFKGVGEYHCEDCRHVQYDDYGKARLYIEKHHGANAAQVEAATGVSQKTIRQMLKDDKLEITADSNFFLKCEICGTNIRSGKLCPKCELNYHRRIEADERQNKDVHGFGKANKTDSGAKRFYYD